MRDPANPGAVRILAVDDDPDILRIVQKSLERAGFEVATAGDGPSALSWIERYGLPHLAVVDIMMPGMDGLELSRRLLEWCDLPIVLLTAVDDGQVVVRSIEEIAEDYVTKPFLPAELVARIQRLLRRIGDFSYAQGASTRVDDRLAIDFPRQAAVLDGREVPLTPTESKLLFVLMRDAPRTVTNRYLLDRLWPREEIFEDTLRVHVHRLRKKIEPDSSRPRYVVTHRGRGYRFGSAD